MKPFLPRVFHAGVIVSAAITRVGQSIELLFRSKADVARRAAGRIEALERRQMELERLDRLRHPSDYQGR